MRLPTSLLAAACVTTLTVASPAAPVISAPFFVADPHTDAEAFPGVTRTSEGFHVGWVSGGHAAARGLDADGALAAPEVVLFWPSGTSQIGFHTSTEARAPVELAPFGAGALMVFGETMWAMRSGYGQFTESSTQLHLVGGVTVVEPVMFRGPAFADLAFAVASSGLEWGTLAWSIDIAGGPLTLSFSSRSVTGAPSSTTLLTVPRSAAWTFAEDGEALASDGTGYLALWTEAGVVKLAPIASDGAAGTVTTPPGWGPARSIRVASNGNGYLVAWVDLAGALRVSPVGSGGVVGSAGGNVVASGVSRALDLDAAGSDYLLTFETAGDGGGAARAARVGADGTVRDPSGFDLGTTAEVSVTGANDDLWLMVYAAHADPERTLLEGRFIGEIVPSVPVNPVPPPSGWSVPEAGTGAGGAAGSGGATGARDAAAPGDAGAGGAEGGSDAGGGDPDDGAADSGSTGGTVSTGGTASTASGGTRTGRAPASTDDAGCSCRVGGAAATNGAWVMLALVGVAMGARQRRIRRRACNP